MSSFERFALERRVAVEAFLAVCLPMAECLLPGASSRCVLVAESDLADPRSAFADQRGL